MGKFLCYLRLQLKRACRLLPVMCVWMLLVALCLGIGAGLSLKNGDYGKGQMRFDIGLVGNTQDDYMGFGVGVIQSVDSSRYIVNFRELTQEEADREIRAGNLSCYVRIPDGLMESLIYGRNDKKVECVTDVGEGINMFLAGELADIVSTLILSSQRAAFGMQEVLSRQGMTDLMTDFYTYAMSLRLFDIALSRTELCGQKQLGASNGISTPGYYLCGLSVFFLMLSGIAGSPLFVCRSRELGALIASKGTGAFMQVIGEYVVWAGMNLLCMTEGVLLLGVLQKMGGLELQEWKDFGTEGLIGFWGLLALASFMISALQFLLYELVSDMIGGILLQFLCGITMGYLAGCFYIYTWFPDILQRIGACLPMGAALRYVQSGITGEPSVLYAGGMAAYLALFLGLSAMVRKLRVEGALI